MDIPELIKIVTTFIDNELAGLPFLNKTKITQIINTIGKQNTRKSLHFLQTIIADLASVLEFLLDEKTSELSIKKLKSAVGNKLKTKTGREFELKDFFMSNVINAEFVQANLKNEQKRQKMQKLHTYLIIADFDKLITEIYAINEVKTLSKEQPHLLNCLKQAGKAIDNFDIAMQKFLDYPISLINSELSNIVVCKESCARNADNDLTVMRDLLKVEFNNKEAVYILSDSIEPVGLRTEMVIIYIYALREIKNFLLKFDAENAAVPKRMVELKKIINKFNVEFAVGIKQLKQLANEVSLDPLLTRGTTGRFLNIPVKPELAEDNENEVKENVVKSKFIIVAKDIKQEDLFLVNSDNVFLINDDELLLAEATRAYAILKVQAQIKRLLEVFQHANQQVEQEQIILSNDGFQISLTASVKARDSVVAGYHALIGRLQEKDEFSIIQHQELVAIVTLIDSEINPAIARLEAEIINVKDAPAISAKLAEVAGTINKAHYMLEHFKNFYPLYISNANKLTQEREVFNNKLQVLASDIIKLKDGLAALKRYNWQDRSRKPLEEVERNLIMLERKFTDVQAGLEVTKIYFPIDSNKINNISSSFDKIKESIAAFETLSLKVNDELNGLEVLMKNAELSKFKSLHGNNPYPFYHLASSSQPTPAPAEIKIIRPS